MLEVELFNLLEGTSDAAFAVSEHGEICSWNKAAEKLFATVQRELSATRSWGDEFYGTYRRMRGCAASRLEIPNFELQIEAFPFESRP
jgi:PAS domain-containing protein